MRGCTTVGRSTSFVSAKEKERERKKKREEEREEKKREKERERDSQKFLAAVIYRESLFRFIIISFKSSIFSATQ